MIKVPFTVDPFYDAKNSNDISMFLQQYRGMPWLTYLLENAIKVTSVKHYKADTHQYIVDFHFHLDPKKETFYRIKYGYGT
jgi:hypothetical protein